MPRQVFGFVESLRSINIDGPFDTQVHDRPFDKMAHDRPFGKMAHDRQDSLNPKSKF
jgi:hypothetical protein